MESKTILITGGTDGIGKATAKALAKQGHVVIIHGRNKAKAEKVCEAIRSETGNNKIDYILADLLLLSDVKRMAEDFKKKHSSLDVLINNAGAFFNKVRETTEEGFEKTITLNLFAPFLLTQLLLDVLKKSASARIINLSSAMHKRGGKPDLNDFQLENSYRSDRAYGLSKLYLIWITRHLSKLLRERRITNITVNASHPGAVATNFGQDADKGFLINRIFKIALLFMDKPEKGAMTSIYLATSPDVENITGRFFSSRAKEEKPDDRYYSRENEKIVWEYCMNIAQPYL
jgi:NAD(P)-dependent dehydrogenase (short-subunit alcohol dehydrogenase family)